MLSKCLQVKETNECLVRVTSPIRKVQQAVKKCQGSENQVKEMHDSITSKKDEYNNITDKLQVRQLYTVDLIQYQFGQMKTMIVF